MKCANSPAATAHHASCPAIAIRAKAATRRLRPNRTPAPPIGLPPMHREKYGTVSLHESQHLFDGYTDMILAEGLLEWMSSNLVYCGWQRKFVSWWKARDPAPDEEQHAIRRDRDIIIRKFHLEIWQKTTMLDGILRFSQV